MFMEFGACANCGAPVWMSSLPANNLPIAVKPAVSDHERNLMPVVAINQPAPDFSMPDSRGEMITLSEFKGLEHVILVLNRGFT